MLVTPIHVRPSESEKGLTINAIWDTGATGSVISKVVAQSLGLKPTGVTQVSTANGIATQNTYTIDVKLTNGVVIKGITVTEVQALSSGCHSLIGMDIITLGDFSITNHNGMTCMSFRVPSSCEVDFVSNPTYGITPIE